MGGLVDYWRVPQAGFENLKDYPFFPNYIEISGFRMHYVDEGPAGADPVLLLHGNPTWSYLYRFIIAGCAAAGNRVVAPDMIGFGKSDKPLNKRVHSYSTHVVWLMEFVKILDLQHITLFCQDWGVLLGLRIVAEMPERFSRVMVSNGMLLTGEEKLPRLLKIWIMAARLSPWLPVDRIVNAGSLRKLDKEELRAYRLPFISNRHKIGIRTFPQLLPLHPDDKEAVLNRKAWKKLERWEKPFVTIFSDRDPISRGGEKYFQKLIPGARGQPHIKLRAGHFIQEDAGAEIAEIINRFVHS
ncbi:haloalkane dehalogenase [candidate division KSB1 bacterium]|nr:haloalkane dehalogenase [candidate division KSB1 bacterium]